MVPIPSAAARSRPDRRVLRRYLPPQHGAWAILALPFAVGVACTAPVWLHLPLLPAWFGGYLFSYYALLAAKTGRWRRVAPQLRLYGAVTAPAAVLVVVGRPAVLLFAPAFAVLISVNLVAARRHADRSLAGGLASVLQGCLMVPIAATVAGRDPRDVVAATVVLLAYFVGSLLYVKTMIRHRGDRGYLAASITVHALAVLGAGLLAWPLAGPFGWFLVRAALLPRRALSPMTVGLIELANSVLLLVTVPLLLS